MKKIIVLVTALVFGASLSWGASSRDNRSDHLVFLGISPLGLHIPTLVTRPVAVGFYLGENLLVGMEYGVAKIKVENGEGQLGPVKGPVPLDDNVRVDGDYTNTGAFLKWFPGTNSFNVTLAANKRKWDTSYYYTVTNSLTGLQLPLSANMQADATVATLGLGNQWMMDFGLVIGVDWLVASALTSQSVKASIDTSSLGIFQSLIEADKQQALKELKDGGNTLNTISGLPGLFILTLGWSF